MTVAHLDAFSGISGDMMVGALLDAGLSLADLERELAKLGIAGYRLSTERRERNGIGATKFVVTIEGARAAKGAQRGHGAAHGHERAHGHAHRTFHDIRALIRESRLEPRVAELALQVFAVLAEAEGKVHGKEPDDVAFHEVGAIDSIVDVIGAAWGLVTLGVETLTVSSLPLGSGFVSSQHGTLPVPGPAAVELLKGFPVRVGDGEGELVTPTGAAIVAALARPAPTPPEMTIERVGYGAGERELADRPNLLRLLVGSPVAATGADSLVMLEANVDDQNPEIWEWVMERLFAKGARDVFLVPTQMKKNRPGILVSVLCDPGKRDVLAGVLFAETSTLGVRVSPLLRLRIEREIREVATRFGPIRVKIGRGPDGTVNVAPEYDDCRKAAAASGAPLKTVYQEAIRAALG